MTYFYFNNFDAPLKRTLADSESGEGEGVIDVESTKVNGEIKMPGIREMLKR